MLAVLKIARKSNRFIGNSFCFFFLFAQGRLNVSLSHFIEARQREHLTGTGEALILCRTPIYQLNIPLNLHFTFNPFHLKQLRICQKEDKSALESDNIPYLGHCFSTHSGKKRVLLHYIKKVI